jgi:hypothetical protein
MKQITIILFLALSFSLQAQENKKRKVNWSNISIHKQSGTIMPFKDCENTSVNKNELLEIEGILNECVNNYNTEHKSKLNLKKYKRQYVIVINKKGEKEVWINFLCDVENINWKEDLVDVSDGGSCYFNLKINLATKSCYNFIVNGIA